MSNEIMLIVMMTLLCCSVLVSSIEHFVEEVPSKIAFGSCNRQDKDQLWEQHVVDQKPDVWIWMGDTVYSDIRAWLFVFKSRKVSEIRKLFSDFKEDPAYQLLRENVPRIIGVYDDHDIGLNDADKYYPDKYFTQDIFLDFLDVEKDDIRRTRDGIYTSYQFGTGEKSVAVYLLDTRFFSEEGKDILGDEQWKWLENEFKESTAKVNVIVSGIQMVPNDKPLIEKWESYPGSLERMTYLISKYSLEGVVFISGDVHMGEMLRVNCTHVGYPLYEFTSSGLTHTLALQTGPLYPLISKIVTSNTAIGVTGDLNFGIMEFDWENMLLTVNYKSASSGENLLSIDIDLNKDLVRDPNFIHDDYECHVPGWKYHDYSNWLKKHFEMEFISLQMFILLNAILYLLCICKTKK